MATYELVALNEGTPQLVAPTSSDTGTIINLTVTGTFTLGDASGDSFAVNSAAWAFNNNVTVTGTWADLGTVTTVDINGGTIDGTTQATGTINGPIAAGGTWTAAATWTLPAFTLGGTVTSNGQSFSGTIANLGTVTTADINGGTIDNTVIGGATEAAATVTTLAGTDATDATSTTAAAMKTAGGLGVVKKIYVGDNIILAAAGKGVDFSANGGTVLDNFDDAGVYAAALTCSTSGTITLEATGTDLSVDEFGQIVHVFGKLVVASVSSPLGDLRLTLPFQVASLADTAGSGAGSIVPIGITALAVAGTVGVAFNEGATFASIFEKTTTGGSFDLANHIQAATQLYVDLWYRKA